MEILEQAREEIEGLHKFFVGWFSGALDQGVFEEQFLSRFSERLVFIPPAGRLLGLEDITTSIRTGYASNPEFRIEIRNVRVHTETEEYVVATYEEWQRNARASTPPDNGRVATVIFSRGARLKWVHIHETWLPREVMEADQFNF